MNVLTGVISAIREETRDAVQRKVACTSVLSLIDRLQVGAAPEQAPDHPVIGAARQDRAVEASLATAVLGHV